ncbi:universal stress protein [Kitasatospora sp. NPDC051853]|uniref:universal stress protein n=1 Tax=Kitasatospora sp. NPDC051853 TaxID=3364058 RepID=UPI0037BD349C
MDRTARVVVGVCGTLSGLAALQRAVAEARARGATLVPVTVWEVSEADGLRPLPELAHAASRRLDTAFEQTFGGYPEGIRIHPVVVRGEAGPTLVAAAGRPGDVLVVGTGGHRRLRHVLHGSVTRYCKTHARCRVIVASPTTLLQNLALSAGNGTAPAVPAGDRSVAVPGGAAGAGHTN